MIHGKFEPKPEDYDILDITVVSLSREFTNSKSELIKLLGTIFMPDQSFEEKKRTMQEEFGIPMDQELEEDLTNMCNLGDGILEYGLNTGEARGKILGAVETMRDDGKSDKDIVARLMKKYGLTQAQAEGYVLSPAIV